MPRCSQPNCRVADTGVCLDGHKQGCPHLIAEKAGSPEKAAAATTSAPKPPEIVRFHTGDKLTPGEASKILNDRAARVVLLAGSRDSGKTTFLARLGEMFRGGTFVRYRFAGSLTLCAFERASWLATINSGASRPKTPRTSRIENDTFYHLRTCRDSSLTKHLDLLISDLAGETFPAAVANQDFCTNLASLGRADHLAVLLDSARLVQAGQRHPEGNNVRAFLQRVVAARKHNPKSLHVQVLFSRWDYVTQHAERAAQEAYCRSLQDDLAQRFGGIFGAFDFHRVAARPDEGVKRSDPEIQSLFAYWLESSLHPLMDSSVRNRQPIRDFSGFGLK